MSQPASRTALAEFLAGCRAEAPILLGTTPFGLIYGVTAIKAGLTPLAAILMSSIVFAGSAQLIISRLIATLTPAPVIVLTASVVNLRHFLYGASIAPYIKHLKPLWRALLGYLLTDEAYAVAISRYLKDEEKGIVSSKAHWYFLGAGLTLWASWQISCAFGVLVGGQIPESWGLDFTLALTFVALTVPVLKDRPMFAAAVAAGAVAVIGNGWPYKLGLMAAALTGIVVGMILEERQKRFGKNKPSVLPIAEGG